MKKALLTTGLLIFIIGNIGAVDIESYQFIDHLRAISSPAKPEIYEDAVLFTVSSSYQRVGIAFAHESYSRVHWFQKLLVPGDPADFVITGRGNQIIDPYVETGIMFHLEHIPSDLTNMDYRLIINGLWMADPLNPMSITGPSGVVESRVPLPVLSARLAASRQISGRTADGAYRFNYRAASGETITVGGSFNNWDPFMYELRETSPGFYSLTLPIPPGIFQYVFFHRGERIPDQDNPEKLYARDGRILSQGQ